MVDVGQHVGASALQASAQLGQLFQPGGNCGAQGVDDRGFASRSVVPPDTPENLVSRSTASGRAEHDGDAGRRPGKGVDRMTMTCELVWLQRHGGTGPVA
jgi:hypothetical protein